MKASEVLKRYAAGERNFRRVNLRGQSFREQNLSGANFSEADIRGATFTNATLTNTNFTSAKAGLQRRWLVAQQIMAFVISLLSGALSVILGLIIAALVFNSGSNQHAYWIAGTVALGFIVATFIAIVRQGFTFKAFLTIAGTVAVAGAIAAASAVVGDTATAGVVAGAVVSAVVGAGAIPVAIAVTVTISIAVADAVTVSVIYFIAISIAIFIAVSVTTVVASSITVAVVTTLVSGYIAWRALKGDEKFALVRTIGVAFGAIGGTSFRGANLTNVNFSKAILKSTNFTYTWEKDFRGKRRERETILKWVCWHDAQKLNRSRLGNTYLANPKIRQLVVTLNGQNQNYDGLNLENVNLQGANLQDASFIGTNFNYTSLQDANLSRAILKQTQLDGTDLTGATITGAYIEDWGITGTTNLNGVQCNYIFMRVPTKENPVPLRKPDNQREIFADGEFADFIQPYVDTLDLYHSQDIDPRAISIAFKKLSQNHPEADLEIVAMEKRGQNSLNLKVRTAVAADKSKLSSEYFADYNQLKAMSEARLLLLTEKDDRIRSLEQMIQTALHQPTFNVETIQGDFMPENNGININAGESIGDISGLVSGDVSGVVNLGTISGNVTNAINQLPETSNPDQPDLKQLLIQLKEAIETDAHLPDTDKVDLLEQVQNLAEAKQTEEPAQKEGLARRTKKMFEATLKNLPDTAKIVEASSKLLPLILKALGFPV